MTIAELLATARERASSNCTCPDHKFARAVVELLDTPAPCAWPDPEVAGRFVTWESLGETILNADDVRAMIGMLSRAGAKAGA